MILGFLASLISGGKTIITKYENIEFIGPLSGLLGTQFGGLLLLRKTSLFDTQSDESKCQYRVKLVVKLMESLPVLDCAFLKVHKIE